MRSVSPRAPAAALLLAFFAACHSGGTPPPPPGPLELSCAAATSGPNPVLTVVGRARTAAAATAPPITVTLVLTPTPLAFDLSGPGWTGTAELHPTSLQVGMSITGQATVDGAFASTTCTVQTGLPGFAASATRTAAGADLSWAPVPGAVVYRWSLRAGTGGVVVASGSTTSGTSASVSATLDPAVVHVAEVGAYALTGAETTYPTPLPSPAASFARVTATAGSTGGDGASAWQLFGPGDFVGGTLTVRYPTLAAGERLALVLVNAGGTDQGFATVSVVGTGNPSLAVAPLAPLAAVQAVGGEATRADQAFDRSDVMTGEALVSARRAETAAMLRDGRLRRAPPSVPDVRRLALAAAPLPATRTFCQGQLGASGSFKQLWKSATLGHETAHAGFYYTDEVKPGIDAAVAARTPVAPAGLVPFWGELGAAYEGNILPALNTYFGPESDVDGNGKVIFLLADLGKVGSDFAVGYFWPGDLELPLATATTCPGNAAGNRADMLYLIDPGSFTANWAGKGSYDYVLDLILSGDYPGVMAHELQHDVNYNTRCPIGAACGVEEELWLDEGLSMLSETVSGYGLHTPTGRANVRQYQGRASSTSPPYYQAYGMTIWPVASGDPYGNYAGVQAFMQYLLDHATPAMTRALENKWLSGKANLEAANGLPFEISFARFTTAAMFSNEDLAEPRGALGTVTSAGNLLANPIFNYLGGGYPGAPPAGDYVPWHHYIGSCPGTPPTTPARVANVAYIPLASTGSATLRQDGWAAFATGPGTGGAATVTVQSSAAVRPHVVVVKYAGKLPNYVQPTCP